MSRLKDTTLRDFSGGWNVLDDDLNLSGAYQPVLDNIKRGLDSTLSVRQGYTLYADCRDGVETTGTTSLSLGSTNGSRVLTIGWNGHPFSNHQHITFPGGMSFGGFVISELNNKPHSIFVVNANSFEIYLRTPATSTSAVVGSFAWKKDTHSLAGNILELQYFSNMIVAVDDRGEIIKVDQFGAKTRIWDASISRGLSGNPLPWTECTFVSSDVFKGQLILANGLDKPLVMDFTIANQVQYLVDLGSGSNANTPICRYVKSVGRWLIFSGDPNKPNRVHFSSTDTSGTFFGDPAPNDGLFMDINFASNSPSFVVRGLAKFRNFVVIGFDDNLVMLQTGIFDTSVPPKHIPSINDVLARNGTVAHKSMMFLGFDLIMLDPIGVPSISKNLYNDTVLPARHSGSIAPVLQRNIGRLSVNTMQDKIFAVYNTHDFEYIIFLPDYDNDVVQMATDPFVIPQVYVGTNIIAVRQVSHGFEVGDSFTVAGAVDVGGIAAVNINKTQRVLGIIDDDFFTIDVGAPSTFTAGGGGSPTMTRLKTETTGYVFTYDRSAKAKTWARYKGLNFTAGTTSVYGRVFLSTSGRIWKFGNRFEPVYADLYNNFDIIWQNNLAITVGQKLYDPTTNETYTALVAHTSALTDTFLTDRNARPTFWVKYLGEDISFAFETPWADFNQRTKLKLLQYFGIDARGKGNITAKMFVDYFYRSKRDGTLTPQLSMDFVGGDTGGFGAGLQHFGAGRIATRQRMWPFPARGKLLKTRIEGTTKSKLKIVALMFEYMLGNIYS